MKSTFVLSLATMVALSLTGAVGAQPALDKPPIQQPSREELSFGPEEVCAAANDYGPVQTVTSVDDGRDGTLVWLNDRDGDLWMCNIDREGQIGVYTMMMGNLLPGSVGQVLQTSMGGGAHDPAAVAGFFCETVNGYAPATVIDIRDDGMGGYIVWLTDRDGDLWLCNATGAGEIFANELLPPSPEGSEFQPA